MRLRRDFPFRRIAVVLSGGGAFGAYEAGVLRVLSRIGLRPAIVAGVSVGALNAVAWVAHDFQTSVLERMWRHLRPEEVGMRWSTFNLRIIGGVLVLLGTVEFLLVVGGWPEIAGFGRFRTLRSAGGYVLLSTLLEAASWTLIAVLGYFMISGSRRIEDLLTRLGSGADPARRERHSTRLLLAAAVLYGLVAISGVPWPRRFHLLALLAGTVAWVLGRPGPLRDLVGGGWLRLFPETEGRGMWRSGALRRLVRDLVRKGDPQRLLDPHVHLIVSACDMESGRMSYFVNWPDPEPDFRTRIDAAIGDVVVMQAPEDVIEAAVASSAVPVLFEPVPMRGREYLDGGLFSNQPLHAVTAAGADAILLVLVSPSSGPRPLSRRPTLIEIASRLTELTNWRDLQSELRRLPPAFGRSGDPAPVCAVEPESALPGPMFGFDPERSVEMLELGERDAVRALTKSGWLETEPTENAG